MITGMVTARREAVVSLEVLDASGQAHGTDVIVDTGFDGWLTLPLHFVAALGLTWKRDGRTILADGSIIVTEIYEATVVWDGQPITILVYEADADPLVGMALMEGFRILIEDVDGGLVQLQRM